MQNTQPTLTSGLVRDVGEEGGDLALALDLRAAVREAGVRARGREERVPGVEVLALTRALVLGFDAVEEGRCDDTVHVSATAAAAASTSAATASGARAGLTPIAAVGFSLAAVAVLAAAVPWLAVAVLRSGQAAGSAEERQPKSQGHCPHSRRR
jgi:hypothetical protein